jgi:hypothetical protein
VKITIVASVFMLCVSGCDMVETNNAPPNVAPSPTTAPVKVETPPSPPVVVAPTSETSKKVVSAGSRFLKGFGCGLNGGHMEGGVCVMPIVVNVHITRY